MKRLFFARGSLAAIAAIWVVSQSAIAVAQTSDGEANFNKLCAACHTIGGGKRVGPDLHGIGDRRGEEWLVKWIASSQGMVRSGDKTAVALFNEYNSMPMPDAALSPAEIKGVLVFIAKKSGAETTAEVTSVRDATPEEIRIGRELFQGGTSLANRGPACSSCHYVTPDAVIGGGVLARELTTVCSRLGLSSVFAILREPPFPVMQQAYHQKHLTEAETIALVGYLKSVGERPQTFDQPREDALKLFFGGLVGVGVLMPFYSYIWRQRKKNPVNQRVFDRQVNSR